MLCLFLFGLDPSLFRSMYKGRLQLDNGKYFQFCPVASCCRHSQGMGYKNFILELLVQRYMIEPTCHILERKMLGLWKKQWD